MNNRLLKSLRSPIWVMVVLALACLAATATSVFADDGVNPAPGCEGMDLEFCLRWGSQYAQIHRIPAGQEVAGRQIENDNTIPVTGTAKDFGFSYWLVVGPAGEEPVQLQP